jgi:hypothetical protein
MKTTRIELTLERYQRLTIRRTNSPTHVWCAACGEQMVMVSGEEAAKLTGQSSRELYRQVEQGLYHSGERADGILLICVESLLASVTKNQMAKEKLIEVRPLPGT